MTLILACSVFFLTLIVGMGIILLLGKKSTTEVVGLSFLFGTLLLTIVQIILLHYFSVSINITSVFGILITISLISVILIKNKYYHFLKNIFLTKNNTTFTSVERVFIALIAIFVLSSFVQNYFWPVTDWDALALYDFRGRIIALNGNFTEGNTLGYFFQYPPYTSLLHADLYVISFDRVKIWYSLLYSAVTLVFYSLLRKNTTRIVSILGSFALIINPMILEHSTMAYTNLAYSIYLSLGVLYLLQWFKNNNNSDILIGSFLIAGSTWVRLTEPLWIIPLCILVIIFLKMITTSKNITTFFTLILGSVFILGTKIIWLRFIESIRSITSTSLLSQTAYSNQTSNNFLTVFTPFLKYIDILLTLNIDILLTRFYQVANYYYVYILPVFGVYLIPAIVLLYTDLRNKNNHSLPLFFTLVAYILLLFFGTLIFSFLDGSWADIGGSANRMSMFLIPLFVFLVFSSRSLSSWIASKQK